MMMKHVFSYLAILLGFVLIDLVWLMGVARGTYVAEMGTILRKQPNLAAAIAFYLLYAFGIWFFAVRPTADGQSVFATIGVGALLGLVAYGTYDLTNLTVMEGFGFRIAMIDLVWGSVLTSIAAGFGAWTVKALS